MLLMAAPADAPTVSRPPVKKAPPDISNATTAVVYPAVTPAAPKAPPVIIYDARSPTWNSKS